MDYIIRQEPDGTRLAISDDAPITSAAVTPDGPTRIFRRRAIKLLPEEQQEQVAWLVLELDGVRCYIDGASLVMTKQDLYPEDAPMTILIKQPNESRVYAVNFRNLMAVGDSISTVLAVTTSPTAQLTLGNTVIDAARVKFRVEDGIAGTLYKITCRVQTANGDTLEGDGNLEVVEL